MRSKVVLIVDDEPRFLADLEEALRRAGLDPLIALDGAQAFRLMHNLGPGMAIVDLVLGKESGLDVIRALRGSYPDIPIIAASLRATEVDQEVARRAGATTFLQKPFNVEWIAAIQAVLGEHGVR